MPESFHALAPPFTLQTAILKVRKAEEGWNSRNPRQVVLAYTVDSRWRNRPEFLTGRDEIIAFLTRKCFHPLCPCFVALAMIWFVMVSMACTASPFSRPT